ncbi:MAG: aromatic amino acid transport family protein [Oscillospiraceae bacterium]|nr:aromatic amino acid transport family protein [Oscillospiraceae bacterium]
MEKKLTTWEAACIITGYGIGGGVLSLPYLAQRNGILISLLILVAAFAASYVLHLMIADLALKTDDGGQIIACLSKFLFRGKLKNVLTVSFFVLMLAILCTNLTGYITGAEEIIVGLLNIPPIVAKLIFYIVAASVVLLGLKAVGVSEKIAMAVIFTLIGVLAAASFFAPANPVPLVKLDLNGALAFYGMAMFSLAAFFSVPQAVVGLGGDRQKIRKAVFLGFLNNFVIIVVICFCAMYASKEVTSVAMIGWSAGIGLWAQIIGSVFTVLAMLTTYWSLSLALADIVRETVHWNRSLSWLVATLPSLVLALFNLGNFMEFMRLAGGLISIIVAVMTIPAFMNARREVPGSILKHNGNAVCIIIIIAYVLMGIGNVVPV